jgi:amidase
MQSQIDRESPPVPRSVSTDSDLIDVSAVEQARLVRTGQVSSTELTRLYLDRIERLNPTLNAFVDVFSRRALIDARQKDIERRLARGDLPPFHGVPIGIKDLNFVRLSWTHFGSAALRVFAPIDDATTTQIRRGGFVILGKLAASEFGAMPVTEPEIHGPTRNPWSPGHTAGGSSGGSASAVAARLLPIAHGSDGGGSVRIPSSFCNLFGLKPSRGRLRNQMWMDDRSIIYTCGTLARSVEDAAAMLDVMAGVTAGKPHRLPLPERPFRDLCAVPPKRLRIRLILKGPLAETDPEVAAAVVRVAHALESAGHHVEEAVAPTGTLEEFLPIFQKLVSFTPGVNWARTQPVTRWLAEAGKKVSKELVASRQAEMVARLESGFGDADAWLTPTVPVLPPRIGAWRGLPPEEQFRAAAALGSFTVAYNLLGYPASSVPAGFSADGRPIGAQIGCRAGQEAMVLALSRQVEEALPWSGKRPPVS